MENMHSFEEQIPCVGVSQFDPFGHRLFGVRKSEATPKMVEEMAKEGNSCICYPHGECKFGAEENLYGRVVWSIDKFFVLVGKWAVHIRV